MLTTDEIKRFIEDDALSEKKRKAKEGQRYYEAEHDILNYRLFYYNSDGILVEDKARSNSKICHPFFTELVDQLAAYMLSFDKNPIRAKETADGLQEQLDSYFDDEFWAEVQELITGTNAKGFEYLYAFKDTNDKLTFRCADSLGVVEVRAKDTDDGCEYIIYWYIERIGKNKKRIKRIEVYDKDQIWFYMQEDDGAIVPDDNEPINPKPNITWKDRETGSFYGDSLGFIPFWRLDNCRKQFSGLKPIKGLIDDYDLMECGLSNNLQDFDKPIHLVKGFEGDNLDELQQNIMTKKLLGVDANGGLEILTVDVPYQARKTKADEDEKNIYRFGMGFNSAQSGDGNVTNVVIRSRYTLLELKADKLEKRLKRFLKGVIQVVLDEVNALNKTDYQPSDIEIVFERIIPTNEQETVQNALIEAQTEQMKINSILNVATVVGDEETLKAICGILDLDFDELKSQLEPEAEDELLDAMGTLEDVEPEDAEEEIEGSGISSEEAETQEKVLAMLESLLAEVE
jgi:SPP1 family phage portal protein